MNKSLQIQLVLLSVVAMTSAYAQTVPVIEWQKSFGGTVGETANSVLQTPDGGFAFAGYTKSKDGDVTGSKGNTDYWVVKMDASGNLQWQKSLGGSDHDAQWDFQLTNDGGFVIAGQSKSNDGDLLQNKGEEDYWIVRLSADGNIIWQRSYGGSSEDEAYSVQQTMDGGFIVAGYSESEDGDVSGNHGEVDYWILKLDGDGNMVWQKCFGGSEEDEAYSVQEAADGGYVVVGESESTDGDVTGNHGEGDYWIIKLDDGGNLLWQKSYGGSSVDYAKMLKRTLDNGFVVAGWSASADGDVSNNNGDTDYWIVKVDESGNLQWEKCLGGSDYDFAHAVSQAADGGYIVGGYTHSTDLDVTGNHGSTDYWLVKLDASGNLSWQKTLGGSSYDQSYSVQQSDDGGYIVAGLSFSNDGDVTGNHATPVGTTQDCWIVKLSADITGILLFSPVQVGIFPNPVYNMVTFQLDNFIDAGMLNVPAPGSELIIRIINAEGKAISMPAILYGSTIKLDMESFPAGCYTVEIGNKTQSGRITGKFVKM